MLLNFQIPCLDTTHKNKQTKREQNITSTFRTNRLWLKSSLYLISNTDRRLFLYNAYSLHTATFCTANCFYNTPFD